MRAILLLLALLLAPTATQAQQVAKSWRLGWLSAGFERPDLEGVFRVRLRELGYIDGQNLAIEYRYAEGKFERLPELALDLVKLRPDVVVAISTLEVRPLRRATTTLPIVSFLMGDPVMREFVTSLARPGGNVTGLTLNTGPEIFAKRLELLRELVPGATRIGLLVNPGSAMTPPLVQVTGAAARTLGVQLRIVEARTQDELPGAFSTMKQDRIQALRVPTDALFNGVRVRLVELAAQARIPVLYDFRDFVDAGGLAAYGPSYADLSSRAAGYVDRVLKGQKPADLPIEQPTKFELVLNRKASRALGLTIPPSLLLRADHIIE